MAFGLRQRASAARPYSQFCHAEIQNLRLATIRHKDGRRLDVAVNDPLGVRGVQHIGDLFQQRRIHEQVNTRCYFGRGSNLSNVAVMLPARNAPPGGSMAMIFPSGSSNAFEGKE